MTVLPGLRSGDNADKHGYRRATKLRRRLCEILMVDALEYDWRGRLDRQKTRPLPVGIHFLELASSGLCLDHHVVWSLRISPSVKGLQRAHGET